MKIELGTRERDFVVLRAVDGDGKERYFPMTRREWGLLVDFITETGVTL